MIKLRDYQENQLNFLKDKIDISNIVGIQSPTGSGKTIVMLEFIKYWFSIPENQLTNVVITTGFNNLVFLMEEQALKMGLNPIVLIGTKACNCPLKFAEKNNPKNFKVFTIDDFTCGDEHKHLDISTNIWTQKRCPYTTEAYKELISKIRNDTGNVIITNHSSFLLHQQTLANTSLLIVDEAHTFSNFYDNYLSLELDYEDLTNMNKAINKIKDPLKTIIKMNVNNSFKLPKIQINAICEKVKDNELKLKIKQFFETDPNFSNFIERTKYSFKVNKFYKHFDFDINPKIVLFSATLDKFTQNMFKLQDTKFYKEYKTFCDYSKSEFIAIPNDDFKKSLKRFIEYVDSNNLKSGIILSTTIFDMNQALELDNLCGFKMFTDLNKFKNFNGKKILVGSRGLFQGIDIENIEFVGLNKIPFPNWDDKNKALQDYLTDSGKNRFDPWNEFTIPKTENDIIQSTGRLWRSTDSCGIVSIFDPRIEKFKYIIKHTMNIYRHGINLKIIRDMNTENERIEEFKI